MNILPKVIDILTKMELVTNKIESTTLLSDLGLESIDILDLIFRLEKEFDIRINTKEFSLDLESLTVNSICLTVEKLCKEQKGNG